MGARDLRPGARDPNDSISDVMRRSATETSGHVRTHVPRRSGLRRVLHMGLSASTDLRQRLRPRRGPADGTPSLGEQQILPAPSTDFDHFYRHQYASVVRLAYSLCGSMQIAEELAQEAFVAAHDRWQRIAGFDRPDLWVRRVVINRSISYRRRCTSERRAIERIRNRPAAAVEPLVGDETIWEALRELSPRQAEVLALFYVEDQPLSAVAEILGLGSETVKTHLKRGRAALAAKLVERGHVR